MALPAGPHPLHPDRVPSAEGVLMSGLGHYVTGFRTHVKDVATVRNLDATGEECDNSGHNRGKGMAAKVNNRSATEMDRVVGRNIRVHRLGRGLSQEALADKLGITFQQVQKYEKGTNRVGAGRLYLLARILEVPVMGFFDGADKTGSAEGQLARDLLQDQSSMRLLKAFSDISNRETRRHVLHVVESLREHPDD